MVIMEGIASGIRVEAIHAGYRVALGGATLVMLGVSWPLWVGSGGLPAVPFVGGLPARLGQLDPVAFTIFGFAIVGTMVGWSWRSGYAVAIGSLAWLVLQDQNRLQPWIYQFLLCAIALAGSSPGWGLRLSRVVVIAIYLHSGLSKLDWSFLNEMGPLFLETLLRRFGLTSLGWPTSLRQPAPLIMPAFEILVALGLTFRRTRRPALVGAIVMHLGLVLILGPWGLDHSLIVLMWNLALALEGLILFGPSPVEVMGPSGDRSRRIPVVAVLIAMAAVLPLFERFGWDAWPSFALYASHNERTEIYIPRSSAGVLPRSIRDHLVAPEGEDLARLDLTGWSRAARGVPIYPSDRVGTGIAEAIAARHRMGRPIRVVHAGRAGLRDGVRELKTSFGLAEIMEHADAFWLNAHPTDSDEGSDRWGFGTDRAKSWP